MSHRLVIRSALALSLGAFPLNAHAAERQSNTLALQVALDRAGFSPGVIDGTMGMLTRKAVRGFQEAKRHQSHGTPRRRNASGARRASRGHRNGEGERCRRSGPFLADIPESMAERAKLDGLHYTSIAEALAEKYHTTPTKLRALNPGATFSLGGQITVPAVRSAAMTGDGVSGWDAMLGKLSVAKVQPRAAKVVVDKSDRHVRVFDTVGNLLAQFPATLGSEHDPLPLGQWKFARRQLPPFNYDPELFWDADASDAKAKLPPGPNGPVGVVWIDLSKEHYGIHGTPEPETVGRTASHGCIRLTNWDAAKLAQMVRAGTPTILQE